VKNWISVYCIYSCCAATVVADVINKTGKTAVPVIAMARLLSITVVQVLPVARASYPRRAEIVLKAIAMVADIIAMTAVSLSLMKSL
jgi:hypothetical protein